MIIILEAIIIKRKKKYSIKIKSALNKIEFSLRTGILNVFNN